WNDDKSISIDGQKIISRITVYVENDMKLRLLCIGFIIKMDHHGISLPVKRYIFFCKILRQAFIEFISFPINIGVHFKFLRYPGTIVVYFFKLHFVMQEMLFFARCR